MADEYAHLTERKNKKLLRNSTNSNPDIHFLTASCDLGVALNGGRRGARFGAESILNSLKSLTPHKNTTWAVSELLTQKEESKIGHKASQNIYADRIANKLNNQSTFIHLGGGHDHAYPLLKALRDSYKKIVIINIDAHCDTRIDIIPHSGTPFRQGDELGFEKYQIYQLGVHQFSNDQSTIEKLKNGDMTLFGKRNLPKDFDQIGRYLDEKLEIEKDDLVFISLDADAIDGSLMSAVSAVNPNGLTMEQVKGIFHWASYGLNNQLIYGIYEYNPILDDLSNKGSKTLANLIYEIFF